MPYYPRKRPLSPRQQKFVEQYLICGVARQAAIRAGYSPAGAGAIAWRLRRMPHVAKAIRIGRSSEARRAQIARERVLLELGRVAFSDIGEVLDWTTGDDITLRPKIEISPHQRAAIAEIAPRRYGKGPRIKFHNKGQALDTIARHLGLFDKTPPMIDLQARERLARDARAILLERLARLKKNGASDAAREAEARAAASLAAGAPPGNPSLSPPPQPSPLEGEGREGGDASSPAIIRQAG